MKKSTLTMITSVSLLSALMIPLGCSSPTIVSEDQSSREPSTARVVAKRRARAVSMIRRRSHHSDLRKKTPLQVLQHFYSKRADGDDAKKEAPVVTSPYVDAFDDSAVQTCLTAACGPASGNWSAYNVTSRPGFKIGDVTPAVEQLWQSNFDSALSSIYKRKADALTTQADRLDRLVQQGTTVLPNHPLLPFLSFISVFELMGDNSSAYLSVSGEGTLVFNESAAASAGLTADQITIMKIVFEKYFIPAMIADSSANPMDNPLVARLRANYPGVPLVQAQVQDAKTLLTQIQKVSAIVGETLTKAMVDEGQKAEILKASTGAELSNGESADYVQLATAVEMLNLVYFDPQTVQALKKMPFDFKGEFAKFVAAGGVANAKLVAKNVTDSAASASLTTTVECKVLLSASLDLNASPLRYRKVNEAIKSVKTAAKSVASSLVDGDAVGKTQSQIDLVQYSQPTTNDQRIQSLKDGLLAEDRSVRSSEVISLSQSSDADQMILVSALMNGKKSVEDTVKEESANELLSACEKLPVESVSDYTLTSQGRISLSWYSANYPQYGVAILAHEMGHMVSTIVRGQQAAGISNSRFSEIRDCVANRNPYLVEPKSIADMEQSTWVEEDWADRFSSLVMEELKRTGDAWSMKENMGCALVSIDSGVYNDNKMAPAAGDVHSGGLFRTLMIGVDRQIVQNECKAFLLYATKANRQLKCN